MALSTKNIPVSSGNLSKTFKPGNLLAKVNSITLEEDRFKPEANGLFINLNLEGVDLGEGFEGFFIDPNDQSKGRHKGQVGKVRVGTVSKTGGLFSFQDGQIADRAINRDQEILKFVASLAKAMGKLDEINAIEADTIEEYIPKASNVLSGDNFIHWTIAGSEWEKNGYPQYNLFLAKSDFKAKKYAFSSSEEDLLKFDEAVHIIRKKKAAPVDEFAGQPTGGDFIV